MRTADNPLDTYLLRVFSLLVAERSVSRTALRLNQSQPAISAALKRLRRIFNDPLLVREKGGMAPTERALALLSHANAALAEIDGMTCEAEVFNPATTEHVFSIGAPDHLTPAFFMRVAKRFRQEAPCAQLTLHALGPDFDIERSLAAGTLDMVIGNWPAPPDRMHSSMLLEDEIVCLVADDHPLAGTAMTLDNYMCAKHIVALPVAPTHRGVIDSTLATLKIQREEPIVVQSPTAAPYILPGSDLVFTTTRHFADFYSHFLTLSVLPAPVEFPTMRFHLLWHDRNHQTASHRWLRQLATECGHEHSPSSP